MILRSCSLKAAYADKFLSATLIGVLTIHDTTIRLSGIKTKDKSEFSLLVGDDKDYSDFIPVVESLSPADSKSGQTIPDDSGLPKNLPGSFAKLVLTITEQNITFLLNGTLNPHWELDLGFKTFTVNSLRGNLNWERARKTTDQSKKPKSTYSLKILGDMQFGDIPLNLAMEIGSDLDSVIQAEVNATDLPKLDLNNVMNDNLGFAPDDTNKDNSTKDDTSSDNTKSSTPATKEDSSTSFSELLPNQTTSVSFNTSAYVYFNMTQKLFILFGQANIGSIFAVAGKMDSSESKPTKYGYAVTISLQNLSTFLPPLQAIENIIAFKKLNGSIVNFGGMDIAQLVAKVTKGKSSLGPEASGINLPFDNLTINTGTDTGNTPIKAGTSLYAEIDFTLLHSGVFSKLISIQNDGTMPADIVVYAAVAKPDSTQTVFIAKIASLTLLGEVTFSHIVLNYHHTNQTSTISLTGNIEIPHLLGDKDFFGNLVVANDHASFSLTGDDQPIKIRDPLNMFGVTITELQLSMEFDFPANHKLTTHYEISGKVNFFSHPEERPKPDKKQQSDKGIETSTDNSNQQDDKSAETSKDDSNQQDDKNAETSNKNTNQQTNGSKDKKEKPSFTLDCSCIFSEALPIIVDITLPELANPLTLSDLSYTLFKFKWSDINLPDIGLYAGRVYYAKKDYTIPATTEGGTATVYNQGYFASCKTFIFDQKFTFEISVNIPSDKTGFSITGSTENPFDFGIITLCGLDAKKNFTNTGPGLTYNCIGKDKKAQLECGVKFLDVVSVSIEFGYDITKSQFIGTVTYPESFLGIDKPSVSFSWSKKKGFAITDWGLGDSFTGFDDAFTGPFNKLLTTPSGGGCKAIVNSVVKNLVKTKFNSKFSTADKSDKNPDDLVAFKLAGTCDFEVVGKKVASIDLPKIIIHITKVQGKMTMNNVANYILNTVVDNAESIVEQLASQPSQLTKVVAALTVQKALTFAAGQVLNSLVCRGADEDEVKDEVEDNVENQTENAENAEEKFDDSFEEFEESAEAVEDAFDAGFSALGGAAADLASDLGEAALGFFASILAGFLSIFGIKTEAQKRAERKRDAIKAKIARAKKTIEGKMVLKHPLNVSLSDTRLSVSWTAFPDNDVIFMYHITVDMTIPNHTGEQKQGSTLSDHWSIDSKDFRMCSVVKVTLYATCEIKSITYQGPSVSKEITQTAKIDPPKSVTATCADEGVINVSIEGIVSFVDSLEVQLLGNNPNDKESQSTLVSKKIIKVGSEHESTTTTTFQSTDYWSSTKPQLMVGVRCLSTGLQSSVFVFSAALNRLPPPTSVSHTLPLFNDNPNDKITLNWSYPENKDNLEAAQCEIVSSDNSFINKTVNIKPKESSAKTKMVDTAQIDMSDFLANIPAPPADGEPYNLGYQVSFMDGSTILNSPYTTELKDFQLASTLDELHVAYEAGSLAISFLPVPETGIYQAEIIENGFSTVVASQMFDDSDRSDGKHLAKHNLSETNMGKLTAGKSYTLKMYSLGNAQTVLYNRAPKLFSDIHYLLPASVASATYNSTEDSIVVNIARVPNAVFYQVQLVEYETGKSPNEITSVTVTDATLLQPFIVPKQTKDKQPAAPPPTTPQKQGSTISATIDLQSIRSNLSNNKQYGIKIAVSGKPQDISSPPMELSQRWTLAPTPSALTVAVDKTDRTVMRVSTAAISGYTSYKITVENTSNKKKSIKTVSSANNTVNASWVNSSLPNSDSESGGQFKTTIQTISTGESTFHSNDFTSPTIITLLQTPSTIGIEYGSNLENVAAVYHNIPDCTAMDFTIFDKTQKKSLAVINDFKPDSQASSTQISGTINPSSIVVGDVLEGVCIAKGGSQTLNSLPGIFTSPAVVKAPSPTQVRSSYDLSTGVNTITWDWPSQTYNSCSLLIKTRAKNTTKTRIDSITTGQYKEDLFAKVHTGRLILYEVSINTQPGTTPSLASDTTESKPDTVIKSLISNMAAKQLQNKPTSINIELEVAEEFKDNQNKISTHLEITAEGEKTIIRQSPPGTIEITDIDITLGVQYTLTLRSEFLIANGGYIIGEPVIKTIDLGIPQPPIDEHLQYYTYAKVFIAFTKEPISRAHSFTIERTTDKTSKGTLMVGFTSKPPFRYAYLPEMSESALLSHSFYYLWKENYIWNNSEHIAVPTDLSLFKVKGQKVTMAMNTNGDIYTRIDEKGPYGMAWFGTVPADVEMHGVVVEVREPGIDWPDSWDFIACPSLPVAPPGFITFDRKKVTFPKSYLTEMPLSETNLTVSSSGNMVSGTKGTVFTADVIPYGSVFQIAIKIGSFSNIKRDQISFGLSANKRGDNHFVVWVNQKFASIFNSEEAPLDLRDLRDDQVVGMAIMANGEVHLYSDGNDHIVADYTFSDIEQPLYGFVFMDLESSTTVTILPLIPAPSRPIK